MANRDLLADAIADAKAVKEVAIANAKAALEEAFTPHLKNMLAQKINEMEDMDEELDLAEADKDKMDEEKEMDEGYDKESMGEIEDMDEELDLDEILAELELEEGDEVEEVEEMDEAKDEMDEAEDMDEAEEEINLEDMSEEELKDMIEDVIEDMVASGELEAGGDPVEMVDDEEEEEGGEEMEMDVETSEEEVELAEGLFDFLKKKKKEAPVKKEDPNPIVGVDWDGNYIRKDGTIAEAKKELAEAKAVIKQLRSDLNEVNLLNSKLLYTNKIFKGKNLTENQKIKVLKAFDKAETVKEAKAIFETLNENLVAKSPKSNLRESRGAASKPAGVAPKRRLNEGIVQEDAMVARFKKLAGIN